MGKINKKLPIKTLTNKNKFTKSIKETNNAKDSAAGIGNDTGSKPSTIITKNLDTNKKDLVKPKEKSKILFQKTITLQKSKTKKEKMKIKKKALMEKIDWIKEQELENAKKKKREKRKIIGDLNPLKDALPSLDELRKLKPDEIKTGIKEFDNKDKRKNKKPKNKIERSKERKKEFLDRYKCLNSILKDKKFRENPRATIAEHIKFIVSNQEK
ncbi:ribosome biogenesis protein SLX9 homolog [Condylostylus longicornis]|uniref:ribosome biogenesis protein SLX9 homolog n=1 Tax=Condylostylus longicornis TaxID=2530218 RepID=UPI00244DBAF7|nr:ribosome biogenesis protein SLX9 homolog [Condylostylus longicornis]